MRNLCPLTALQSLSATLLSTDGSQNNVADNKFYYFDSHQFTVVLLTPIRMTEVDTETGMLRTGYSEEISFALYELDSSRAAMHTLCDELSACRQSSSLGAVFSEHPYTVYCLTVTTGMHSDTIESIDLMQPALTSSLKQHCPPVVQPQIRAWQRTCRPCYNPCLAFMIGQMQQSQLCC